MATRATKSEPAAAKPMPKRTGETTRRRQIKVLEAFARCGVLAKAIQDAPINRSTHFKWLAEDPVYAEGFAEAKRLAIESLESEVIRRGRDGWEEPVYQGGHLVGVVQRFDSKLLMFALEHLDPDRWGKRVTVLTEDVVDAEIRRLADELERARATTGQAAGAAPPPG